MDKIFPIFLFKNLLVVRMGKGKGSPEYYACRVNLEELFLKLME